MVNRQTIPPQTKEKKYRQQTDVIKPWEIYRFQMQGGCIQIWWEAQLRQDKNQNFSMTRREKKWGANWKETGKEHGQWKSVYFSHLHLKIFHTWKFSMPVFFSLAAFLCVFPVLSSQHEEQGFASACHTSKNLEHALLWSSLLILNYIISLHFLHGITASFSTAVVIQYFVLTFLFSLWFRFFVLLFLLNIYTKVFPRSQNCLFPSRFFLWDALHLNTLEALISFPPRCSCCEMDAKLFSLKSWDLRHR